MQTLANVVQKGWPDSRDEVPISVRGYWMFRDEITVRDGLIFKGNRVIIPKQLQKHIIVETNPQQPSRARCLYKASKRCTVLACNVS